MSWFKKLIKKEHWEHWEYICENGHVWKEKDSPKSLFMYGSSCTKCPICHSIICNGTKYIDGECVGSAIHSDFDFKIKEVKNARSNNKKSKNHIRRR
jgi:hypothetical protein